MHRWPILALALAPALLLVGCDAEPDPLGTPTPAEGATATPTPETPTPTVTPTPAPTPTGIPLDQWYGMTAFQIADEDDGLDFDQNGTPDNGIYVALDVAQTEIVITVHDLLYANIDQPGSTEPCEATKTCIPATTAYTIEEAVTSLVNVALEVRTINAALKNQFELGQVPYVLHMGGTSVVTTLDYYTNYYFEGTYTLEDQISTQVGSVSLDGATSSFGPGSFAFGVNIDLPVGEDLFFGFTVFDAITELQWSPEGVEGATGGGVAIAELVDLLDTIIVRVVPEELIPPAEEYEAILGQLEASLVGVSDIQCSTGQPCMSITFEYEADAIDAIPVE